MPQPDRQPDVPRDQRYQRHCACWVPALSLAAKTIISLRCAIIVMSSTLRLLTLWVLSLFIVAVVVQHFGRGNSREKVPAHPSRRFHAKVQENLHRRPRLVPIQEEARSAGLTS